MSQPTKEQINKKFNEFTEYKEFYEEIDINGLFHEAQEKLIANMFKKKHRVYLHKKLRKINVNQTVTENLVSIEQEIKKQFGSLRNYAVFCEYHNLRMWIYPGMRQLTKDKLILKTGKNLSLVVPALFCFCDAILNENPHSDYAYINNYLDNQKTQLYEEDGYVNTTLFLIKRFKNGRLDIIFNKAGAEKIIEAALREEETLYFTRKEIAGANS